MNMEVDLDGLFRENYTIDYEDDYEYVGEPDSRGSTSVVIPVLYSLVLVIGLFGNGLLLAILALKRRSWTLSDTFILHLSVTDVLLLVTLPLWAVEAAHRWCFGAFLCKFSGAVFNINFYCGILLLLCITLDRYLSVVHGIQLYSPKKLRLVHISCLSVWLISLILSIPDWIFMVATNNAAQEKTLCVPDSSPSATDRRLVSHLPHHVLGFLLPAATLIICCSCILLRLQRSPKVLQTQKAFIMIILPLMAVFFVFWVPYNITLIVDTTRSGSKERNGEQSESTNGPLQTALMVTKALACIHACLRPLLYFSLCGNFRKRVLTVLSCEKVEKEDSLWELGVGEEVPPERSHDEAEALNQMSTVDHQVQSTQC